MGTTTVMVMMTMLVECIILGGCDTGDVCLGVFVYSIVISAVHHSHRKEAMNYWSAVHQEVEELTRAKVTSIGSAINF